MNTQRILVTGGAGYIGAHVCRALAMKGHIPVVLDDLSTGHRSSVQWGELIEGSLLRADDLDRAFKEPIHAVIHLAAKCVVSESVAKPAEYYEHNVVGTARLLEAMERHGTERMIFSSTCALYAPSSQPLGEDSLIDPQNPYALSKWMAEELIRRANSKYTIFRYFNASGAAPDGSIGESHDPETHLIPLALRAKEQGKPLTLFGTDWPTPDGTCVRDYVHVDDIADAHLAALEKEACNLTCNLGTGRGRSVLEILSAIGAPWISGPRRPGDAPSLVCNSALARDRLGLAQPRSLDEILSSAAAWEAQLNHSSSHASSHVSLHSPSVAP